MDLHHSLLSEFPEYRQIIKHLKATDEPFRRMFEEYHSLDDAIYRVEEEIDFATDQELEELKMKRARLKDWLYHAIRHAGTTAQLQTASTDQQRAGIRA